MLLRGLNETWRTCLERLKMKKIFWFVFLVGLSVYLVLILTFNEFLSPVWWQTATVEQVRERINNGADVNAKDKNGRTGLWYAVRYNNDPEVIKALIAAGADVNGGKDGPVVLSCLIGNSEIVKILIAAGAEITAKDKEYIIAGSVFLGYRIQSLFKKRFKRNVNVVEAVKAMVLMDILDAKDTDGKALLLRFADSESMSGNLEIVKAMIEAGADVNVADKDGVTVLMSVVGSSGLIGGNRLEITRALLSAGADVNAKSKNGGTALMKAASSNGDFEILKELIAAGADINAKNDNGQTALDIAKFEAGFQRDEILKALRAAGAK